MESYQSKDLAQTPETPQDAFARVSSRRAFRRAAAAIGFAVTTALTITAGSFVPETPKKPNNDQLYQYVPRNEGKNEGFALFLFMAAASVGGVSSYFAIKARSDSSKLKSISRDIKDGMFWKNGMFVSPNHYFPSEGDDVNAAVPSVAEVAPR